MKILAGLAVVIAGIWLWTSYTNAENEHRLAAVASELAGRRVGVRCQGFWAAMVDIQNRSGEVEFPPGRPPDHMFLTHGVCGRLSSFMSSHGHGKLLSRDDAEAVNTLVHESMHLRGIQSEAEAQCYAIQEDAWAVVRMGGTEAQGDAVAKLVLSLQPDLPDEYQSGDCRAGGSLDLFPRTPAFPSESPPVLPPS